MVNVFSNQSEPGGSFRLRGPWGGCEWGYPELGVPKMFCISTLLPDSRALLLLMVSVPCAGGPAVTWAPFCTPIVLDFPHPHPFACSIQLC